MQVCARRGRLSERRQAIGARRAVAAWAVLAAVVITTHAADVQPKIAIELNRIQQVSDGCEALLVLRNDTATALEAFRLDLVLFDLDGIVTKRLAVEAAPLAPGKTVVRQFVIPDAKCTGLARMLLNEITECRAAGDGARGCSVAVATSSRTTLEFFD